MFGTPYRTMKKPEVVVADKPGKILPGVYFLCVKYKTMPALKKNGTARKTRATRVMTRAMHAKRTNAAKRAWATKRAAKKGGRRSTTRRFW